MRRSRPMAVIVTFLLLMGQAALSLASAPCACHASGTRHSCCCGHPEGQACPCSSHGSKGPSRVKGSCSHDELAAAGGSMEAPAHAVTPAPAPLAVTILPSACSAPRALVAWHGPPLPSGQLTAHRTVVLRT